MPVFSNRNPFDRKAFHTCTRWRGSGTMVRFKAPMEYPDMVYGLGRVAWTTVCAEARQVLTRAEGRLWRRELGHFDSATLFNYRSYCKKQLLSNTQTSPTSHNVRDPVNSLASHHPGSYPDHSCTQKARKATPLYVETGKWVGQWGRRGCPASLASRFMLPSWMYQAMTAYTSAALHRARNR